MMRWSRCFVLLAVAACAGGSGTEGGAGGGAGAAGGDAPRGIRRGNLEVLNAVAPAPVPGTDSTSTVAAYFQVMNEGPHADTLYRVEAVDGRASMHDQQARGGRQVMVPILSAVVPAGTMLRFAPGAQHVMVEGVRRALATGDSLAITLYFRRTGSVPVSARVVGYAELEGALNAGADAHAGH
jgi:copper(I)-binding protein